MHLKETNDDGFTNIQDEYYWNILANIRKYVPEFETVWETDNIYPIVFELGEYLIANFNNFDKRKNILDFIDDALHKGTSATEDLLVIQLFQQLYDEAAYHDIIKKELNGKSKEIYDRYYDEYLKGI